MKKLLTAAVSALLIGVPSLAADPAVKGWKTHDSLGCMMLRECLDDTYTILSTADLETHLQYSNFDSVREETDAIIAELTKMNVGVYLASDKYFPRGHAGVYSTVSNHFFLNDSGKKRKVVSEIVKTGYVPSPDQELATWTVAAAAGEIRSELK